MKITSVAAVLATMGPAAVHSFPLSVRPVSSFSGPALPPVTRQCLAREGRRWPFDGPQPLRSGTSSHSDEEREASSCDDIDSRATPVPKPKPFISRRVRRGPIGAATSGIDGASKSSRQVNGSTAIHNKSVTPTSTPAVLKVSKKWACVANCGACCYLAPSERPYLLDYFDDPKDLAAYNSMVGDDGWCIHYDKAARACTVFEDRPWFCRVEGKTFEKMYGVTGSEMDKFCTSCCREQIADVYGTTSGEMLSFNMAIKHLKASAGDARSERSKGAGGFGKGARAVDEAVGEPVAPIVPIDPFTKEASDKEAAMADWIGS